MIFRNIVGVIVVIALLTAFPSVNGSSPAPASAQEVPTETPLPPVTPVAPVEPAAPGAPQEPPLPQELQEPPPTPVIEVIATLPPPPPEATDIPLPIAGDLERVVQAGETLDAIAAQSSLAGAELAQLNGIVRGDLLLSGQVLKLPAALPSTARVHRVAPGDTLFSLAAQYGVSPSRLRRANLRRLICERCLVIGQVLSIPAADAAASPQTHALPAPFTGISIGPNLPRQGDVIVISVTTAAPLQSLIGTLAGRPLTFVQKEGAYLALSGVSAVQDAGVYSLTLRSLTTDGVPNAINGRVRVGAGQFAFENLTLGQRLVPLLALDVNLEERTALDGIFKRNFTGAQYWNGPFNEPIQSRIVSYYGTRRNFNRGTLNTFHSGVDLSARIGTPIGAAAAGKVVAVEPFPVRGNVVILDHGRGVFTIYCHLSKFNVAIGDLVDSGEIIGYTGNTGRSLGPHLHFELAVGGVTVNPLPWLKRALP
jgi:murein DD-endopeptidase MepM/ murein hydrolase activator NlpD